MRVRTEVGDRPLNPRPSHGFHIEVTRDKAGVNFAARPDLGEATEIYELEILSGSSVVRTLSTTSPSLLYAATDETLDFGSAQASFSVRLYQISAPVGRGLPAIATLIP